MASLIRTNFGFFLIILFIFIIALWIYGLGFDGIKRPIFAFDSYTWDDSCATFKDGSHEEYTYALGESCSISSTDNICWGGLTIDGGSLQIGANTTLKFIDTGEITVTSGTITLDENNARIVKTSASDPCLLCMEAEAGGVCADVVDCNNFMQGCFSKDYECGGNQCCCWTGEQ